MANINHIKDGVDSNSKETSRNASPIRKDRPTSFNAAYSSQPSAAALQRALSASNVQQLQNQQQQQQSQPQQQIPESLDLAPRKSREVKATSSSGSTTPQWPISPRLKSPPPSGLNARRGSSNAATRRTESSTVPNITIQNTTPANNGTPVKAETMKEGAKSETTSQSSPSLQAPPKTISRGPSGKSTLETVQENSSDAIAEPSAAVLQVTSDLKPLTKITDPDRPKMDTERQNQAESGSESAGNKSDPASRNRRTSMQTTSSQTQRPKNNSIKSSYSSAAKRHAEGKQGMTVETEVVQSIPQAALNAGDRSSRNDGGSVRLKPSNETIRPKKERKKNERKPRSINQNTATSKADLFEARVASAVDEANTSDSDETFVYESNPPEHQRRQRHHSRTPSVTSSHSVADRGTSQMRSFGEALEDRRIAGKRSMKFSSNPYNDVDSPDSKDGTVRTHTPRHVSRHGRGGHHTVSNEPDSPFTQASKGRKSHLSAHSHSSRPSSPRSSQSGQYRSNGLFNQKNQESSYDFDAEQNADDERTPLVGSMRNPRVRYPRHMHNHNSYRSASYDYASYDDRSRRWFPGRLSACLLTTLVVVLVIVAACGFAFMSNQPLKSLEIRRIDNVLASQDELMFDLLVSAINPNTLGITINDMDVTILAKSKHNSTSSPSSFRHRRRQTDNPNPSQDPSSHWLLPGHDHGTDPDPEEPDPEPTARPVLLGRVFAFDQPLVFEASPFKQHEHRSLGQLRLMAPGNDTETGGTARWEQMLQYPFELIVRGVLKYPLPVSAKIQKVAVGATVVVHPEDGVDKAGRMRTEPVVKHDGWEWVDFPDDDEVIE